MSKKEKDPVVIDTPAGTKKAARRHGSTCTSWKLHSLSMRLRVPNLRFGKPCALTRLPH